MRDEILLRIALLLGATYATDGELLVWNFAEKTTEEMTPAELELLRELKQREKQISKLVNRDVNYHDQTETVMAMAKELLRLGPISIQQGELISSLETDIVTMRWQTMHAQGKDVPIPPTKKEELVAYLDWFRLIKNLPHRMVARQLDVSESDISGMLKTEIVPHWFTKRCAALLERTEVSQ